MACLLSLVDFLRDGLVRSSHLASARFTRLPTRRYHATPLSLRRSVLHRPWPHAPRESLASASTRRGASARPKALRGAAEAYTPVAPIITAPLGRLYAHDAAAAR